MVYITQLIYIKEAMQDVFDAFEKEAIPIIARYGGTLLLRTRNSEIVEQAIEPPYEIHIVSFPTDEHFERFMKDETRKTFLHLKEQSVREVILIKGQQL